MDRRKKLYSNWTIFLDLPQRLHSLDPPSPNHPMPQLSSPSWPCKSLRGQTGYAYRYDSLSNITHWLILTHRLRGWLYIHKPINSLVTRVLVSIPRIVMSSLTVLLLNSDLWSAAKWSNDKWDIPHYALLTAFLVILSWSSDCFGTCAGYLIEFWWIVNSGCKAIAIFCFLGKKIYDFKDAMIKTIPKMKFPRFSCGFSNSRKLHASHLKICSVGHFRLLEIDRRGSLTYYGFPIFTLRTRNCRINEVSDSHFSQQIE